MSFFDDLLVLFTDKKEDEPIDVSDFKEEKKKRDKSNGGGFFKFLGKLSFTVLLLIIIGFYLTTGIYKVGPKEVGVIKRFGKYTRQVDSGLHYHLPYPFETVETPKVTQVRRIELGFRTINSGPPAQYRVKEEESLMLTGDLAIVSAHAVVKYKIKDPIKYLFLIKQPNDTVRDASEAALRQIIGQNDITDVLTKKKTEIQIEVKNLLQETLDNYQAGIYVDNFLFQDVSVPEAVQDAYRDVASAKEDKHKKVNQANAYKNQVLPQARGEATEVIRQAEGYKAQRVAEAEGNVARFNELLKKYKMGKEVTRTRLYLETMEEILPNVDKVIVGNNSQGILKLLNLDSMQKGVENR